MPNCAIVIPSYNEEARLNRSAILRHLTCSPEQSILFVDDGSTDCTPALLEQLQREMPAQISVLHNESNAGKAEAVRRGLLHALGNDVQFVGYWDADLATPLDGVDDLLNVLVSRPEVDIVIGSRVKLLGRVIERHWRRHYLGRAFATCASLVLDLPVYDTQCGAKLFRATSDLRCILAEPFLSRWIFDVELLARFLTMHGPDLERKCGAIYEFPLNYWRDVPGSKLRLKDFLRAAQELVAIRMKYGGSAYQKRERAALWRQQQSGLKRTEKATGHRVR
jgi:dolichyl-phosphate beta-glucosyltransferase